MGRFEMDPKFLEEILKGQEMKDFVMEITDEVAIEARRIARAEAYDEGDYHDGIEAIPGGSAHGDQGSPGMELRTGEADVDDVPLFGRVNANDFKSNWIEFGTGDQEAKAPLRRALENTLGTERTVTKQ